MKHFINNLEKLEISAEKLERLNAKYYDDNYFGVKYIEQRESPLGVLTIRNRYRSMGVALGEIFFGPVISIEELANDIFLLCFDDYRHQIFNSNIDKTSPIWSNLRSTKIISDDFILIETEDCHDVYTSFVRMSDMDYSGTSSLGQRETYFFSFSNSGDLFDFHQKKLTMTKKS
tara:strand:+ start:416 stop:937 length:522 start_codon:yes stop_codon:yes gene_type:complete